MLGFAAVAVVAHTIVRKFVPAEDLIETHDVTGFLMGVVGVLYSVVIGFLVGAVWTSFAGAQQTSDLEAGYVADAYNFTTQFDSPSRPEIERLLAQYAIAVRSADWSRPRKEDRTGDLLRRALILTVEAPPSKNARTAAAVLERGTIQTAVIGNLRNIGDTRRIRLVQAAAHLPAGMYEALLLGAVVVVAFAFLFGVKIYLREMIMTALLAGAIGLFFGLIVELSTPYSGALQVSRDAWTLVIDNNNLEAVAK